MKQWIEAITLLIQNLGFPIAVCAFLLIKYDKKLGQMTEILVKINTNLENLISIANGDVFDQDTDN